MKLAIQFLCFLHLIFLSFGLVTHTSPGRSKASPSNAGYVNQDRRRPLFARRGLYEQQRIHEPKSTTVSPPQNELLRPKAAQKPMMAKCSQLGQSCVPLCGCCDPCSVCHCRFFNAICFCRKPKPQCGKKTLNRRKLKKSQRHNPKQSLGL